MSDLTPIAGKLARLLPRLASDKDGEVLATVVAIRRQLAAQDLDLHDLARALEPQPAEVVYVAAEPPEPRTWSELARWIAHNDRGRLKSHERSFVEEMARRLVLRGEPSEKQAAWLRGLYAKVEGEA